MFLGIRREAVLQTLELNGVDSSFVSKLLIDLLLFCSIGLLVFAMANCTIRMVVAITATEILGTQL